MDPQTSSVDLLGTGAEAEVSGMDSRMRLPECQCFATYMLSDDGYVP